ncbi:hypothetical protein CHCC14809_1136 [Bacillus licheniformis]|nr:hypothetical protein CHCC5026_4430 [Bacillus licheniformis]TWJ85303.1 hypothetical protein CHCC20495_0119 [Bacillus licheniformis]TWJ97057.1 hypothetical protein CHCC20493_2550 [Bacillus licheniformis]TWK60367.1 hypothetical protein CHCC20343_3289 [Bacillus licheniformis]TWM11984.1 hypothetical protein CHCC15087_2658 [Bacillus licheniformis]
MRSYEPENNFNKKFGICIMESFFEQDEFEVMKDEKESFCQPRFILFAFCGSVYDQQGNDA